MQQPLTSSAFDLPERLAPKADPALIADDERHFAAVAKCLEQSVAELTERLDAERRGTRRHGPAGDGPGRGDPPAHRPPAHPCAASAWTCASGAWSARTAPSPCTSDGSASPTGAGRRLLVDWRSPPPSRSSGHHARPMGLVSRRRYRWTHGRISDYWDEGVHRGTELAGHAALGRPVRLHREPGRHRSARMRDVLGTIQGPTRTPSSGRDPAAPSWSTAAGDRQDGRRPAPLRLSPALRSPGGPPPRLCCSSARTGRTWPTSPTSCPAWAREGCRPARTAGPRGRGRRCGGRDRPGGGPPGSRRRTW